MRLLKPQDATQIKQETGQALELQEKLIALEKALLTFDVRHSVEKLKELLAPEFHEIGASGAYFGFDSVMESLPNEKEWSAHAQDFEYHQFSHELVQLVFRCSITAANGAEPTYSLRTSL